MAGASPPSGLTSYDKQNTSLLLKSTWLLYAPLLDIYSKWIVAGLLDDIKAYPVFVRWDWCCLHPDSSAESQEEYNSSVEWLHEIDTSFMLLDEVVM